MKYLYESIPLERISEIKYLWDKLRQHHESMSPNFPQRYRSLTFEGRMGKMYEPGIKALIEVAKRVPDLTIAGYCVSSIDGIGNGEIDSIYVEQEFRRQGIADTLVDRSCEWMDREKAVSKKIIVASGNEQVYRLYQKHGFFPIFAVLSQKTPSE